MTSETSPPEQHRLLLADYLVGRRWFAAKGREFTVAHVDALPWLVGPDESADGPWSRVEIVTVEFTDGSRDTYQVPVAYLGKADPGLEYAFIGYVEVAGLAELVAAYDAVFVKESTSALFDGFVTGHRDGTLEFNTVEGTELPESPGPGAVMTAEQSNTSVVYGDDAILKLFRRISPGVNPDIEIHLALTRIGNEHVAPLLGWLRGRWTEPAGESRLGDLGMLQVFLRTASDGWALALASVRDLLSEEDLHPAEVGGDFAGESTRLGEAVAAVHQALAEVFGPNRSGADDGAALADVMQARLSAALDVVPDLAPFQTALTARFDALRSLDGSVATQRVHGDLHLGQTLRTVKGWKLIDFEGEPAKSIEERSIPSSPLRDVAGMLRSFDYAAGATLQSFGAGPQLAYRAEEWKSRNRAAFLAGYASVAGEPDPVSNTLLPAFEADKAIYEAVYETRNRPTWVGIPLHAIAQISAEE